MKIYLEIAILDNLIINCILLYLTGKFFKASKNRLNIFLASLIGTIFAIVFPLIHAPNVVLIFLKILLGIVMVYISFMPKSFKNLISQFVLFFTFTFILAGLIFAVYEMLGIDIYNINILSGYTIYPVSVFVIFVCVFVKFSNKFIKFLFKYSSVSNKKFKVRITHQNKTYILQSFLDSGNLLKDENTMLPVCILSRVAFFKIYKQASMIDLVLKKNIDLDFGHYINFTTISSKSSMFVFKPEKVEVFSGGRWEVKHIMIGVSLINFNKRNDFDILLNGLCEV